MKGNAIYFFEPLQWVKTLQKVGVTEKIAEIQAKAFKESHGK